MPDNKSLRHPLDGKMIDINDPKEVRNWCEILHIAPLTLLYVVGKVGKSAKNVKDHLDREK